NYIALHWLHEVFLPKTQLDCNNWRLLLLNGYGGYVTVNFFCDYIENKVFYIFFLPYTTHVLQILDLHCYSLV
ncbi:hypothetical protein K469DRAFT_592192, partial [Zopfia rhizophila CBS 207.26]